MKNLLLVLLVITSLPAIAQKDNFSMPRNEQGEIEYLEVVSVDSATQETLYSRARLFVANAFTSATDVTKLEDAVTSTIITKGIMKVPINPNKKSVRTFVKFKFTIQCKDDRYKYSVSELYHEDNSYKYSFTGGPLELEKPLCGGFFMPKYAWHNIKVSTDKEIKEFIGYLRTTMAGQEKFSSNDNW